MFAFGQMGVLEAVARIRRQPANSGDWLHRIERPKADGRDMR
jgi:hypothetical protein